MRKPPPALVLVVAVLGISIAAPLIRLSAAHPLAIAVWRLAFSLAIIVVLLLATGSWRQWRRLDRRGVAIALGAGAMLALHFWSWNTSIGLTSVAASVVLVNMHPIMVAVISAGWLGESPDRRQWVGIGVAMIGALVVASADFRTGDVTLGARAVLGDLLAVLGAATAALYFVVGRRLRQTLDLWPYVGLVYGACLATLLLIAALLDVPLLGQPRRELAIFAALAVGPMMLGHTGMNWALRYLPAYVVTLTVLGEPVGATLLAWLIPGIGEVPPVLTLVGGVLILAGVLVTARRTA